jgi:hypothetical protein
MGRRSRQREAAAPASAPPPEPPQPRTPRRHARIDEAPKAPWHPVPLVELAIFLGLVLIIVGFVSGGSSGGILVTGGLALVALASLELAIREHLAGYRSHSALLAGAAAVGVGALAFAIGLPQIAILLVAVAVGVAAFAALRGMFQRKAGGLTWRA